MLSSTTENPMNQNVSEFQRRNAGLSIFRRSFLFLVLLCSPALVQAQLTLSQTYSIPHSVDASAFPVFFNLSAQYCPPDAAIFHTQLSIDFGKAADLFDDPPFYSDIGLVLRKLDSSFSILGEVTLLDIGSFNDGFASTFFDGAITFDDDGATLVNSDPDQPASGVFRPMMALGLLNGIYSPYWELRLVDAVTGSPLFFHSATLTTTVMATVAVPEPSSIGLAAGVSLLGLAMLRRRRLAAG